MDSDGVDLHLEHSSLMHTTGSDNTVGENLGRSTQAVTNDPQPEKSDKSLEDTAKRFYMKRQPLIIIAEAEVEAELVTQTSVYHWSIEDTFMTASKVKKENHRTALVRHA
ncbi:uncharacterized protein LOC110272550 [Arachis duranensis]|uniref:Uncharacterized protein LOC110272550 n=1 Tax=Arachis duranensis TaxID=130453 RepID=A0A9C6SZV7_ARADU|nr:uncharacterized protein LOC110272550 [Arachis duranensis]XP_052107219.1 uncharacterized protein LOC110272550 [Arachis duranensis]XP_052107220.1 uncharacterized protein LOC110272550 [Arachis duranensis]